MTRFLDTTAVVDLVLPRTTIRKGAESAVEAACGPAAERVSCHFVRYELREGAVRRECRLLDRLAEGGIERVFHKAERGQSIREKNAALRFGRSFWREQRRLSRRFSEADSARLILLNRQKRILRAWSALDHVVPVWRDELGCFADLSGPRLEAGRWALRPLPGGWTRRAIPRERGYPAFFDRHRAGFEAARDRLAALHRPREEDRKRLRVLDQVVLPALTSGEAVSLHAENLRHLGDALIVAASGDDEPIVTSNVRDIGPLAEDFDRPAPVPYAAEDDL